VVNRVIRISLSFIFGDSFPNFGVGARFYVIRMTAAPILFCETFFSRLIPLPPLFHSSLQFHDPPSRLGVIPLREWTVLDRNV